MSRVALGIGDHLRDKRLSSSLTLRGCASGHVGGASAYKALRLLLILSNRCS